MTVSSPIFLGSGRYLQAAGAIHHVGRETSYFGSRALVVAGETSWQVAGTQIGASLDGAAIAYRRVVFSGYCCEENTEFLSTAIRDFGADVVVAVGGGRCMDAAKWAAHVCGLRLVTVPTSAATCAACVALCIHYNADGSMLKAQYAEQDVAAVIVDDEILARHCPTRLQRSGMVDAMGKLPELTFSSTHSPNWETTVTTRLGLQVAAFTTKNYLQLGRQALADVENRTPSREAKDLFGLNLLHTGLISSLVTGGRQLAVAHAIYYCVTRKYQAQRKQFLHGEVVSAGLALQMAINGRPQEEIAELVRFLEDIGAPACLSDIGIEMDQGNKKLLVDFIGENVEVAAPVMENIARQIYQLSR